ncbi:MAG: hypothetical protein DRG20_04080 [Deltaproteobacteria bacterium]|nr:adenylate/guanylate cyclase domain-containing protein [Deltaproteobacteria bacterium]RLA89874.1 MAG: hypothetical protein DRG20_04080 [Deltaproteobacteria bacterium]
MKKKIKLILPFSGFKVGFIVTLLIVIIYFLSPTFFELFELKLLDLRFISRGSIFPGNETVIVAIDEKSLDFLGRWPWSREKIAALVDLLSMMGAKVIAFDIIFSEKQVSEEFKRLKRKASSLKDKRFMQKFLEYEKKIDEDLILASSMKKAKNVVLGYFFHLSSKGLKYIPEKKLKEKFKEALPFEYSLSYVAKDANKIPLTSAYLIENNLKVYNESATHAGFFNIIPDIDGNVRWLPMVIRYKDHFFPPLSLQALRIYIDSLPLFIKIVNFGVEKIKIGKEELPVDEMGRFLINFYGPSKTFPHYSFVDVINKKIKPEMFKNKIVLVGATAVGLSDLRATPFGSAFPGVEIHATVIDNILHKRFLFHPQWIKSLELLAIILFGLSLALILPKTKAFWASIIGTIFIFGYFFINQILFNRWGIWLNLTYPLFSCLSVYVAVVIFKYMTEEREKKRIKGIFQHYVAPSVVDEILRRKEELKIGGERRELSVLFSDIRGFTEISENMHPVHLTSFLNKYLTPMTEIVFKHEGTLDKYMGDAIMAIFGAPIYKSDHAKKACLAALDMIKTLKELKKEWERKGMPIVNIGIGINSGLMAVGNLGSSILFDYTVMGDNVNLGSRLEGLNKEYGTNIIISEYTYKLIGNNFYLRELDLVRVKGKKKPVRIYELIGDNKPSSAVMRSITFFEQALKAYREMKWEDAIYLFEQAKSENSKDKASELFILRCKLYKDSPPPADWDGIFIMTKK